LLYASGANTLARLAKDTNATRYLSNTGTTNNPAWAQITLTNGVTGILPVANGGTNASSASITAFNNITGYSASGATGTTTTNLVFSTSPTITTPSITGDLTMSTGNVVMSSGKGIDFTATAGTGTSELFADYEEGTWTPSVGGLATYTARTGTYTKVGRLVTIQGDITINLILTGSIYTISGLPYTAGAQQWGSVGGFTGLNTGNIVFISCYVDSGTTNLSFNGLSAAGVTSGLLAPFKNSAQIAFSISYYV